MLQLLWTMNASQVYKCPVWKRTDSAVDIPSHQSTFTNCQDVSEYTSWARLAQAVRSNIHLLSIYTVGHSNLVYGETHKTIEIFFYYIGQYSISYIWIITVRTIAKYIGPAATIAWNAQSCAYIDIAFDGVTAFCSMRSRLGKLLLCVFSFTLLENCFLGVTTTNPKAHIPSLVLPSTFVWATPARAQSEEASLPDLSLAFSIIFVLSCIAGALSWVASLKTQRFEDGQPRSTSLYRVFQARMRAGEFAELGEKDEKKTKSDEPDELDAFVDAYVEALEEDNVETDNPSTSTSKTKGIDIDVDLEKTEHH